MNTIQIEHLLKKDPFTKTIFKKACAKNQLAYFALITRLLTSLILTQAPNLESIGSRCILISMERVNILTVTVCTLA